MSPFLLPILWLASLHEVFELQIRARRVLYMQYVTLF